MPRGDGTGPLGQGRGTGRGNLGKRRGRNQGNRPGAGPAGNCVCPACGEKIMHRVGVPCFNEVCPNCGAWMVRE